MIEQFINKIYCGDAVSEIMQLPANSVDLVVTSPPYYKQRTYNQSTGGLGHEPTQEKYVSALLDAFEEVLRVVKPTGNVVYNLGDKYQNGSLQLLPYRFAISACEKFPVRLVNTIMWVKRNPTPRQFARRLVPSTEPFFHFALGPDYYYDRDSFLPISNKGTRRSRISPKLGTKYRQLIEDSNLDETSKKKAHAALNDVIQEVHDGKICSFRMKIRGIHAEAFGGQAGGRKTQMTKNGFTIIRIHGNVLKRDVIESPVASLPGNIHTAIFPLNVIRELIRLLSPPDSLVLDPYMGSGTTAIAALTENRKYFGIDIDPIYCSSAKSRISAWEMDSPGKK